MISNRSNEIKVTQLGNVHLYQLYLQSGRIGNYCYLMVDLATKKAALVDPAWDLKAIESLLHQVEVNLVAILLTHSHYDHINLINPLLEAYNPQVIMAAQEIDYYKFACPNLVPVRHGDVLKLGKTDIQCLLTPGHTSGSMCFLLPDCLFTGDTIFIEGCGICSTAGGSPEAMYHSIQMLKRCIAPDVLVYPGHHFGKAPGCSLWQLLQENIYFKIEDRDQFVALRMRKNQKNLYPIR